MRSFVLSFSHIICYQTLNSTTRICLCSKTNKNKLNLIHDVTYFVLLKAIKAGNEVKNAENGCYLLAISESLENKRMDGGVFSLCNQLVNISNDELKDIKFYELSIWLLLYFRSRNEKQLETYKKVRRYILKEHPQAKTKSKE